MTLFDSVIAWYAASGLLLGAFWFRDFDDAFEGPMILIAALLWPVTLLIRIGLGLSTLARKERP